MGLCHACSFDESDDCHLGLPHHPPCRLGWFCRDSLATAQQTECARRFHKFVALCLRAPGTPSGGLFLVFVDQHDINGFSHLREPVGSRYDFSGTFQLFTPHHHLLIFPPILAPPISAPLFQYRQPANASVHSMPCTSGRKTYTNS